MLWYEILLLSFALSLGVFLSNLVWRWKKMADVLNKLPMLKLKFYYLLGHTTGSMYVRLLKLPWPYPVYDFMLWNGYSHLFRTKSIAGLWLFVFPVIQVHRADSVETILNHNTEIKKSFVYKFTEPWLGQGLLTSHGAKWRNRRKLLTPAFHFNILKDFVVVFNKQSRIFADVLSSHIQEDCIDIVPPIIKCSFDIMCETVLGVETHAQTNPSSPYLKSVNFLTSAIFERMLNPFLHPDFLFKLSPLGRKFFKHIKLVHEFTEQIIAQKKKEKLAAGHLPEEVTNDDSARKKRALLDLMLDEHINNNSLSEKDIREEVDTFTFEGHDTTAMALSWAMYLIGLHPGVQEKLHQELDSIFGDDDRDATPDDLRELKYLECVLKESLRLYPSVPYFGRQLEEDLTFQGMLVPKGTMCMIFPYFVHRDPDVFPNPEKFDPDRFTTENSCERHPFAYIPFSAGPRNCIGQRFALMEEKVVVSTVLRRFKLRSLDPRDKIQVMNQIILRPLDGLRIEIRPRDYEPETPPTFFYYP